MKHREAKRRNDDSVCRSVLAVFVEDDASEKEFFTNGRDDDERKYDFNMRRAVCRAGKVVVIIDDCGNTAVSDEVEELNEEHTADEK